jgi:capsid protein
MDAYELPYEIGTGDLKQTTYSSGKIGMMGFNAQVGYYQTMMATEFCEPIWEAFVIYGARAALWPLREIPCDFKPDRKPPLEPEKEAGADLIDLNMGVPWQIVMRKRALDPLDVLRMHAEDFQMAKEAGLDWMLGKDGILGPGRYLKFATSSPSSTKAASGNDVADTGSAS